jgi:hypothetical protein
MCESWSSSTNQKSYAYTAAHNPAWSAAILSWVVSAVWCLHNEKYKLIAEQQHTTAVAGCWADLLWTSGRRSRIRVEISAACFWRINHGCQSLLLEFLLLTKWMLMLTPKSVNDDGCFRTLERAIGFVEGFYRNLRSVTQCTKDLSEFMVEFCMRYVLIKYFKHV